MSIYCPYNYSFCSISYYRNIKLQIQVVDIPPIPSFREGG